MLLFSTEIDGVVAALIARRTLRTIEDAGVVSALKERPNDRTIVGCGMDEDSMARTICFVAVIAGVVVDTRVR